VILTVNNHNEKAFSSSIIHVEKASPEKMFRLRRVINLPRWSALKKKISHPKWECLMRIQRKRAVFSGAVGES